MEGWIKLHRKMREWCWYQKPLTCRLFEHLILCANHKPANWQTHRIERGGLITSLDRLSNETGMSVQSVRTAIKHLKSTDEITCIATKRFTYITICNYDTYQTTHVESHTPRAGEPTQQPQSTNNKQECKDGEEDKNEETSSASCDADQEHYLTKKGRKLTGQRLDFFNQFWEAFNYKKDKASAADAWHEIPTLNNPLVETICAAAGREANSRPEKMKKGLTPIYAEGWLRRRRWEDGESKNYTSYPEQLAAEHGTRIL